MQTYMVVNADTGTISVVLGQKAATEANERGKSFSKYDTEGWQTTYKKGLANTSQDKTIVERTGALAEQAFHVLTGLTIDTEVKQWGNSFDFSINVDGKTLKIEVGSQIFDLNRIFAQGWKRDHHYRKARERGKQNWLPLKADIYVFAIVDQTNFEYPAVMFEGWIAKKEYEEHKEIGFGKGGAVENYYIHKSYLCSMVEFLWTFRKELVPEDSGLLL